MVKAKVHPADVHDKEGAQVVAEPIGWEAAQNGEGLGGPCLSGIEEMGQGCPWLGPGGGETLVEGSAMGVGSRRSRASGSGYSCGIPSVAQALGGGAHLGLAGLEPAAFQGL